MPSIIRLQSVKALKFSKMLRNQIDFINTSCGEIKECWIHIGCVDISEHINMHHKENYMNFDPKNWIRFLGFSKIDNCPIFFIPDDCFFGDVDEFINFIREDGLSILNINGSDNPLFIDNKMKLEFIPSLEYIDKRVYSEVDPYREENWED